MLKTTLIAAAALAGAATLAHAQDNPMVGGAEMMADMTIAENAANAPNLTALVGAASQAGMVETLAGEGPFTVFAPTDEAFGMFTDGSLEALMANEAQLQQVLGCHVVATEAFSTDIAGMIEADGGRHPVETVGGCTLTVYMDGDALMIEDENGRTATVETADVDQSNGVVHVIDRVLLPAGQAG